MDDDPSLADQLLEANSLSRVWQMANDPERAFAVLTAFRSGKVREENLSRNAQLVSDIRAAGYGFWVLDGAWVENEGTPEEKHVSEDSLFVSIPSMPKYLQTFEETILRLAAKYGQEAVLLKLPGGEVEAVTVSSGKRDLIGKFAANKIGWAYSKIRGRNQTFVFESAYTPGWGRAMIQLHLYGRDVSGRYPVSRKSWKP